VVVLAVVALLVLWVFFPIMATPWVAAGAVMDLLLGLLLGLGG
jgi:hypothetical protein